MIYHDLQGSARTRQDQWHFSCRGNIGKFLLYVNYFYPQDVVQAGENGERFFY